MFEQNQDLFYLFERFQHLKGTELQESMELREHAATVMSTLDESINSLNHYDNFVAYLHSIGELHRKVPGFKRAHFWVSFEAKAFGARCQVSPKATATTADEHHRLARAAKGGALWRPLGASLATAGCERPYASLGARRSRSSSTSS